MKYLFILGLGISAGAANAAVVDSFSCTQTTIHNHNDTRVELNTVKAVRSAPTGSYMMTIGEAFGLFKGWGDKPGDGFVLMYKHVVDPTTLIATQKTCVKAFIGGAEAIDRLKQECLLELNTSAPPVEVDMRRGAPVFDSASLGIASFYDGTAGIRVNTECSLDGTVISDPGN